MPSFKPRDTDSYTVRELADRWGVYPATIYERISREELRADPLPRGRKRPLTISVGEVERWERENAERRGGAA